MKFYHKKMDNIFNKSRLQYKKPNYLITCQSISYFIISGTLHKTINIQLK